MFKVSRVGQDLDAAALLIRHSASFLVVSLDGAFKRRKKTKPLLCKMREAHTWVVNNHTKRTVADGNTHTHLTAFEFVWHSFKKILSFSFQFPVDVACRDT